MKQRTPVAYAVAVWTSRRYIFFGGYVEGREAITLHPCCAKLYASKKEAQACADFLAPDVRWEIVPMYERA